MGKKQESIENRINTIVEGIDRLKGKDILQIDLTTIDHSECNYFIICHGTSNTQVSSIAQSVEETMEELAGESAWHKDGYKNAIWILLDYGDIMVHIFQEETRSFYNLEGLWADAKITKIQGKS